MRTIKEVMDIKVENFDLSVRSTNCWKRAGVVTLSQLTSLEKNSLNNMKNFGKKSMEEIISKLQSLELKFNMTERNWVEWGLRHIPLIKQL